MRNILILNGPNLNMTGKREPEKYGSVSMESIIEGLVATYDYCEIKHIQSNHEGDLIDAIQTSELEYDGILINAGGLGHSSISLRDAIINCPIPVIEVHMSNVYAREEFRHSSMISGVCDGVVIGFKDSSYKIGLIALFDAIRKKHENQVPKS